MNKEYFAMIGALVLIAGLALFFFFHWLAIVIVAIGIVLVAEGISGYTPFQQAVSPAPGSYCPTCKHPLRWIPKYSMYYCYKCQKYL